jgi:hypothetical protein
VCLAPALGLPTKFSSVAMRAEAGKSAGRGSGQSCRQRKWPVVQAEGVASRAGREGQAVTVEVVVGVGAGGHRAQPSPQI